jgi:hypothetical protein
MPWYAPASGKRGRQRIFSDAAIPFCLSIKCLFNLALRQSLGLGLGLVESLLRLAGLNWRVPDFSTVCQRPEDAAGATALPRQHRRVGSAGGQHRDQVLGRRRVETQAARGRVPAAVAQGAPGH